LDNDANLVDEAHVLDLLESASDHERGLGRLGKKEKGVVQKLHELVGDVSKVAGTKQNCTVFIALLKCGDSLQQQVLRNSQRTVRIMMQQGKMRDHLLHPTSSNRKMRLWPNKAKP
jgi:hypothetical protein